MKKIFNLLIAAALFLSLSMTVQAATYTDFTSGDINLSQPALSPVWEYVPFIHYRQFDLGSPSLNDGTGVTNGDVVRLFNIGANTFIEEFGIRVTTAALISGVSAEVGDGADIDGYVGNNEVRHAASAPWIDLSALSTGGVSAWRLVGPVTSGASFFAMAGVSVYVTNTGAGAEAITLTATTNMGPYFTNVSGASPYLGEGDTIDMTIYVDKAFAPGTSTGVTPVFEAYVRGFKRVVP